MANPTLVTLTSLINSVRERSDMVNSQFVTDSEITGYINDSYAELYDLLVQKYGDDYYIQAPFSFNTDGTTYLYPLPLDFYKIVGVDLALSNTIDSYVTITNFSFRDRNRYAVPNFQSFYGVTNLRYRIMNTNPAQLWLTPIPAASQTIRVWYIPKVVYFVNPGDTADFISGWEEYVIIDAAIKCMQKEESDTSVLFTQKGLIIKRIESAAENRDAGIPPKVVDGAYNDFSFPSGSGSGDGSGAF